MKKLLLITVLILMVLSSSLICLVACGEKETTNQETTITEKEDEPSIEQQQTPSYIRLIANLNVALAAESAQGDKHTAISAALKTLNDYGYGLSSLKEIKDVVLLWDSKNDVICYLDNGVVKYSPDSISEEQKVQSDEIYKLWQIVFEPKNDLERSQYSIYVASQAVADSLNGKTVSVGVAYGGFTINELKYSNSIQNKDVTFYTFGENGTLTIDATKGTVTHYGTLGTLVIEACAASSYIEKGKTLLADGERSQIIIADDGEIVQYKGENVSGDDTNPNDPEINPGNPDNPDNPEIDPGDPDDPTVDPVDPNPDDPTINPDDPNPDDPKINPPSTKLDFSGLETKLVEVITSLGRNISVNDLISYSINEGKFYILVDMYKGGNILNLYTVTDDSIDFSTQENINQFVQSLAKDKFDKTSGGSTKTEFSFGKASSDISIDDVTYSKEGIEGDNPFARQCGVDNAWMTWVSDIGKPVLNPKSSTHYASSYQILSIFEENNVISAKIQPIIIECDKMASQEEILQLSFAGDSYVGGELVLNDPICLGDNLKKEKVQEENSK